MSSVAVFAECLLYLPLMCTNTILTSFEVKVSLTNSLIIQMLFTFEMVKYLWMDIKENKVKNTYSLGHRRHRRSSGLQPERIMLVKLYTVPQTYPRTNSTSTFAFQKCGNTTMQIDTTCCCPRILWIYL